MITSTCKHHWMIVPPNGKTSTGTCKHCNEQKEFENAIVYNTWGHRNNRNSGGKATKQYWKNKKKHSFKKGYGRLS